MFAGLMAHQVTCTLQILVYIKPIQHISFNIFNSFRLNMNMKPALESDTDAVSLLGTRFFDADQKTLEEYLKNNQVQQCTLDEKLMTGFHMVQEQDRKMSDVAPTLKLLLLFGAKWRDGALLNYRMTPYHIICQSTGDHDELLDSTITVCGRALVNIQSHDGSTALLYGVQNANINCVKKLIANGASINVDDGFFFTSSDQTLNPIMETILRLKPDSKYPHSTMTGIFDILLDALNNINMLHSKVIIYALLEGNVQCVRKMIQKGASLRISINRGRDLCSFAARMGNVELLKCVFDLGISKNMRTDKGRSVLSCAMSSGNVETIRFLLDITVTVPSCIPPTKRILCKHCGKNNLSLNIMREKWILDPCKLACEMNMPKVVQLLEEYGHKRFKFVNFLRHAVIHNSVEVVAYLLNNYAYPLNLEYATEYCNHQHFLKEACFNRTDDVAHLLLDHGAELTVVTCEEKFVSVINAAIEKGHVELVARMIRSGADIRCRSYTWTYEKLLPFETSVECGQVYITEILLVSGCPCGVYSMNKDDTLKVKIKPELRNLLREWNVHENNVTPLKQQCRREVLKQLSPQTEKKVTKPPLPSSLINYLSITELDDIIELYRESCKIKYF